MKVHLYKVECLTNLHVGSGDINYNVVDNEVEKDINGYPMIHSSGVKGALREQAEKPILEQYKAIKAEKLNIEISKVKITDDDKKDNKYQELMAPVIDIFGQEAGTTTIKAGSYKFLDANIISRPLRVYGSSSMASIPVFSIASINDFIKKVSAFGITKYGSDELKKDDFDFDNCEFITTKSNIFIEGERTAVFSDKNRIVLDKFKDILGEHYALVNNFDHYPLPVLARNYLEDGTSKNLWYEEVVPHGSVFYTIIITPTEENKLDMTEIKQIGGHASIGCGFTKFTELN